MLVNPMNVVGTGLHKGRTSEYLPLCTINKEEERSILGELEFDVSDLQEYYTEEQLINLEENVRLNYITELEKDVHNVAPIIHNLKEIVKRKVNDITN